MIAVIHVEVPDKEEPSKEGQEKEEGSFLGYVFPLRRSYLVRQGEPSALIVTSVNPLLVFLDLTRPKQFWTNIEVDVENIPCSCTECFRAWGHQARWIVDWSDHVWTEDLLNDSQWIHLDPCEAAVDKPLLYQNWGKQQTYIIGFYAPNKHRYPIIEDLTSKYTSDDKDVIEQRREEAPEEFEASVAKATEDLRKKIANLTAS
jgi:hypothetical protein